uniref:putative uncharacterized protein C5orf58 homolog n=1 Tax=Jaculus jaculus TaxID=51337 RepID=UPI001E1B2151|nr:putative uncharacterized protein C5orf58 homolog [Jaculus jaculus]XP_045007344.1 putative uncharacterized protein C5orf58 homolog [Jaculus jaculus]XP_045007345.1 putative uncharacterized protein C5orf58 homolog [Jaculus jaculus]
MAEIQETTHAMADMVILKDNNPDHKQTVETLIKNLHTISLEVKKMRELSQLLLCDLTLQFNQPVKTEHRKEANSPVFEESEMPDVSLDAINFSA